MFDLMMTGTYFGCCGFAIYRGYRKIWIATALFLALMFQYVLEFSDLSLLVIAGIFILYFVVPRIVNFSNLGPQGKDPLFDLFSTKKLKLKFSEFYFPPFFKKESKPTYKNRRGSSAKSKRSKYSRKTNQSAVPRGSKNTATKIPKRKTFQSKSSNATGTATHLQNAVHQLAREKQELANQVIKTEKKYLLAEDKLKTEREISKKHQTEMARLKKRQTSDSRTPEKILGVKPGQYSSQELRDAWIMESKRWHTSNMGNKPQELVELAEEELKRVNAAYDDLKKNLTASGK